MSAIRSNARNKVVTPLAIVPNASTILGPTLSTNSLKEGNISASAGISSSPISSLSSLSSAPAALDWFAKDSNVLSKSPIWTAAFSCIRANVANALSCLVNSSADVFVVCSNALVCTSASVIAIP